MPLSRGGDKGIRAISGPDHNELTAEMAMLAKLPMPERLRHARKRRAQQLKDYASYERQIGKESVGKKKNKKGSVIGFGLGGLTKRQATMNGKTHLQFADSILLLDAVGRNDISEGMDV